MDRSTPYIWRGLLPLESRLSTDGDEENISSGIKRNIIEEKWSCLGNVHSPQDENLDSLL